MGESAALSGTAQCHGYTKPRAPLPRDCRNAAIQTIIPPSNAHIVLELQVVQSCGPPRNQYSISERCLPAMSYLCVKDLCTRCTECTHIPLCPLFVRRFILNKNRTCTAYSIFILFSSRKTFQSCVLQCFPGQIL